MLPLRVFLPFALGYFLSYLLRVVNAIIAPDLTTDVGLDAADLGLLTSAYFLTFALFQLPLGLLLDRFGPRRTEATLLLFAAAGAVVFALADGIGGLVAGRALIGFGVSACLMAAFKAFVLWFPRERLPLVNGCIMAAGGLGALAGTTPVEALLAVTDWRGLFQVFAGVALVVAATIIVVVPERTAGAAADTLADQLAGLKRVFTSGLFWRVAPLTVASQAAFLAIQSLWAGPWLRHVAELDRAVAAQHLQIVAIGMVAGFFGFGVVADRLRHRGVGPMAVAVSGMILFMATQVVVVMGGAAALPVWPLFGCFGTSGIITYAALSQRFPPALAGRVNTGLNVLAFAGAFAAQWGIGAIIELWPTTAAAGYAPAGFRAAFAVMLSLQLVALGWFFVFRRRDVPEG
jgi:sugar phosphate permease